MGLNDDYKVLKGSILMMKHFPTIDQVHQLIIQEEKQRSLSAMSQINSNVAAFSVGDLVISNDHTTLSTQQRAYNHSNQASH